MLTLAGREEGRGKRAEGRGQRAEGRGKKMRRVLVVAFCSLLFALCSSVRAEIVDRVLAILPGQIITLSDVEAAIDLGLVEAPAGETRIPAGLSAVIDRVLILNEVRRVSPPEPSPAAIDGRVARIRQRIGGPAEMSRVLATRGLNETVLRLYAADDLRLASYLEERFSAAAQPTDEEVRQAGESARQRLTEDRRRTLIGAWTAELRRRADVMVLPP
jgi:hypothetical protein